MAATRVYSTVACWVAGLTAVGLAFLPRIGAAIQTVPGGVLGGVATVLYGMIGVARAPAWRPTRQRGVGAAGPVLGRFARPVDWCDRPARTPERTTPT